jgi:carboxymethylenebutenolidase
MPTITDSVSTPDGACAVTLATPAGDGPWPGVVLFPDAGGARPAMTEMAERLAADGYAVLVPDVYYRDQGWAPFNMATVFGDADERKRLFEMIQSLTADSVASDAAALFDYLAARPEVSGEKFGTTGYCMGGRISLTVAGQVPDRVAAAMSFHGGRLATDEPDSPHLLADKIGAYVYVGAARDDGSYTPEQSEILDKALTDAGVEHRIEWYDALHGFAVPDHEGVYDQTAADRHYAAMREVFGAHLA